MKDNFSNHAAVYAKYRPDYPPDLFAFILSIVKERSVAWDCATGNGQTAVALARHFEKVYATDISQKQLDEAVKVPNVIYSLQPAEQTNFPDHHVDLITISQALHWFAGDNFYAEVRRVAKPNSWIAAWMYNLLTISPAIDELVGIELYKNILGGYWDKERSYVDSNYSTISFPFAEIACPAFVIQVEWTLGELEGYLNSWSALQKFISANGCNPVDELIKRIKPDWEKEKMEVRFPVTMRMGQIR